MNARGYSLAEILVAATLLSLFWLQFVQLQRSSLQRAALSWQQFQGMQAEADRLLTGQWPTRQYQYQQTVSIRFSKPLEVVVLWPP